MKYKFGLTPKLQKHEHRFDYVKVVKIEADNPNYSIAKNGTWSFIVRYCECGTESVIDYLPREAAEERIDLIMERG